MQTMLCCPLLQMRVHHLVTVAVIYTQRWTQLSTPHQLVKRLDIVCGGVVFV